MLILTNSRCKHTWSLNNSLFDHGTLYRYHERYKNSGSTAKVLVDASSETPQVKKAHFIRADTMLKLGFAFLFLVLFACTCLARPLPEEPEHELRAKRDADGDDNDDDGDDNGDDGGKKKTDCFFHLDFVCIRNFCLVWLKFFRKALLEKATE